MNTDGNIKNGILFDENNFPKIVLRVMEMTYYWRHAKTEIYHKKYCEVIGLSGEVYTMIQDDLCVDGGFYRNVGSESSLENILKSYKEIFSTAVVTNVQIYDGKDINI